MNNAAMSIEIDMMQPRRTVKVSDLPVSVTSGGKPSANGQNTILNIKPLNSEFESFGEAIFSWLNSDGYENRSGKCADGVMVKAFVDSLGYRYEVFQSNDVLGLAGYFESEAWLTDWIEQQNLHSLRAGTWFKLDDFNRPIGYLCVEKGDSTKNITVAYSGASHLVEELFDLTRSNVKFDTSVKQKTKYIEVISRPTTRPTMGGEALEGQWETIDNPRVADPAYYPYLDGGIEALIKDFLESDETVLILKGSPGTGKSSAIAAATDALDLLPIYAKKADVLLHKDLVSYVFKLSDQYMSEIAGTEARARKDLFKPTPWLDNEYRIGQPCESRDKEESSNQRVPVIIIEDADLLLLPRSQGNVRMSELLNETDGVGSNQTRKIIFTTNLANDSDIDEALTRPGRCYDVMEFRYLTPDEAVAARAACGLPEFDVVPTKDISLAEALRKPRKKIRLEGKRASLGFC